MFSDSWNRKNLWQEWILKRRKHVQNWWELILRLKNNILMKILEFKRSGIRLIMEFFGIPNGFPNQGPGMCRKQVFTDNSRNGWDLLNWVKTICNSTRVVWSHEKDMSCQGSLRWWRRRQWHQQQQHGVGNLTGHSQGQAKLGWEAEML